MSLPVLTEDEIFSSSINPPSSDAEVGVGAEDLDCFQFVDDCHEPDEAPEITDVEMTQRLVAMQVHLQAIGELLSMHDGPMPDVVEIPEDPDRVTHSVATWPNEGIGQTKRNVHPRELVPRPARPKASRRRRRKTKPVPTQTGFEDLVAPRSEVLEFAKLKSNLLFPFKMLPNCTGTVSPGYKELQMPAMQASVECCPEQQQFPHYEPIQQFSPMCYESIPFFATGMDFPFATPQPHRSFAPTTNAPAVISTIVTTARNIMNMVPTGETPTGGVDMSTRIEILHSPQVEIITTHMPPTIHDLSSQIMTAPQDLEVSFTAETNMQTQGYFWGVQDEQASGSECQFNGPITWSNGGSPINWPNPIDCMPTMPPPQLEFPSPYNMESLSPYMDLLVNSPIVMRTEVSPTRVPEHVPVQLVPEQSQILYFVEQYDHRHIPAPTEPRFSHVESREHRHIPAPTEPKRKRGTSHVEPGKHRQTKQQEEGTTSEGSAPISAPVSAPVVSAPVICGTVSETFNEPVKNWRLSWTQELHERFEEAITYLGGPSKATPKKIRNAMSCREVNIYQVKSHLQKYRINPHCFDYGSPSSGEDSRGSRHNRGRRNSRDSNASSSEQRAPELADQQTLARTLAIMQQEILLMEESKELQAKMDVKSKEMQAQIDDMEKQGKYLQRMMDDQHEAMA